MFFLQFSAKKHQFLLQALKNKPVSLPNTYNEPKPTLKTFATEAADQPVNQPMSGESRGRGEFG